MPHRNTYHKLVADTHFTDDETEALREVKPPRSWPLAESGLRGLTQEVNWKREGPREGALQVTMEESRETRGALKGCR